MAAFFVAVGGVCNCLRLGCVKSYLYNILISDRTNRWYGNRQWATLGRQNVLLPLALSEIGDNRFIVEILS